MPLEISQRELLVGVVIAGGGIKPVSASYLFDLLEELDIPIHVLAATSGGAPAAAMKAIGLSGEEIRHNFELHFLRRDLGRLDYSFLMSLLGPIGTYNQFDSKKGFISPAAILEGYEKIFGDMRIEEVDIPLIIQATDVYSGESVILEEGSLVRGVFASGSLVPLLPPMEVEGHWLMEGGFSRETPLSELVKSDIDLIINISFKESSAVQYHNCLERYIGLLNQSFERASKMQRVVNISMHNSEMVMIEVNFQRPLNFWEGKEMHEVLEHCKDEIYQHSDDIVSAYKAASQKLLKDGLDAA